MNLLNFLFLNLKLDKATDKVPGYYHIRQNELKAYKNSFIQTKEMLLARKFKLLKK